MFWFNGWTVYLMKGVSNMAIKKYIGARYAPKFMGAWDKASEYAALSVVYTNEQSYVSRKTVPANTEITNTEFWIKSADWNAQVTQYNQNVEQYQANVERYNQNVETYMHDVVQFYADTLHSYDTKSDMVADRSLKLGDTLLTCGNAAIGDGGGSFYQVVGETSAKAVALENGLFALPFDFDPMHHDYITPEQYGAVGDGVTDDTAAINEAILANKVVYLKETTYLIDGEVSVQLNNGVLHGNNATFKIKANGVTNYAAIVCKGQCVVDNLNIIGERDEHTGTAGEWGMCMELLDCHDTYVNNVHCKNGWGDGLYIGVTDDNTPFDNKNIYVTNSVFDNNRRNGISVIHGDNIIIDNCTVTNNHGTNPQQGIDVEPNTVQEQANVTISNCFIGDNWFANIATQSDNVNCNIVACTFKSLTNLESCDIECGHGNIVARNCTMLNAKRAAFRCGNGNLKAYNTLIEAMPADVSGAVWDAIVQGTDIAGTAVIDGLTCNSDLGLKTRIAYTETTDGQVTLKNFNTINGLGTYHYGNFEAENMTPATITTSATIEDNSWWPDYFYGDKENPAKVIQITMSTTLPKKITFTPIANNTAKLTGNGLDATIEAGTKFAIYNVNGKYSVMK